MIAILLIVYVFLIGWLVVMYIQKKGLEAGLAVARRQAEAAQRRSDEAVMQARSESQSAIANSQAAYEQKIGDLNVEANRIREHYEAEAKKLADHMNQRLAELEPLRAYANLKDAETEVRTIIADALAETSVLRQKAQLLLDQAREAASEERAQAEMRVREIHDQADALLTQATRDAGRVVAEAERRAEQIGGLRFCVDECLWDEDFRVIVISAGEWSGK